MRDLSVGKRRAYWKLI